MIETGTLLQDRYLIEKQIGAGGMGAVYIAIDKRFDSHVAIKETFYQDDELGEAFEREARLLNSLIHPVLPHVSDYFTENNGHFLVMQFIEGEDLSDALKRDGAFPFKDVMRWTASLLDALDYLHSQEPPIIHRDIKPHNIKLTARSDVFLLDFGLAKLNSEDTTGAISVFGYSRTYSPLEQIQGTGTDARSDIFALGATIYYLLTGKPPVDALARAAHIVAGKPDPLRPANEINPQVPPGVADILTSALALNPDQRFISAKAMNQAVDFALSEISALESTTEKDQPILAAAMPIIPTVNSAETDSFPALEAFSAEVNDGSPVIPDNFPSNPSSVISSNVSLPLVEEKKHNSSIIADASTVVAAPRSKTSGSALAATAAALIIGALAVLYLIAGTSSPVETGQTPIRETAPIESNTQPILENETETGTLLETENSTKAKPEIASASTETPKTKDASTDETNALSSNKRNDAAGGEIEEAVKESENDTPPPSPKSSRPSTSKTPRRVEPEDTVETRSRVVEEGDQTVSDIESIFTGESNETRQTRRQRREERRRQQQGLSDQESEDLRRERQQRRRERRNQPLFPPF